ncbi:hypothetical protein Zm00014a_010001 [Zea mays]|uniref:Uncharacterized protein n=1 Tax=Zea mays TaxID=4577 RepID=A0A317Y7H7_MAIZE|nr:hypothetical protein Zm00014a_010001 [Zea mays]
MFVNLFQRFIYFWNYYNFLNIYIYIYC